jgi:hypothetical protein
MSNQASDCGTTGMILVQHLAQENPKRHERRINPVKPDDVQRFQCLRYRSLREHIRKRQFAILQELPPQKTHLLAKSSMIRKRHREASLPVMDV